MEQGISRRPKGNNNASAAESAPSGKPNIQKAQFDTTKKKEVGVSDLTLISKVSNEAINENLKKRFENREIYVWPLFATSEYGYGRVPEEDEY